MNINSYRCLFKVKRECGVNPQQPPLLYLRTKPLYNHFLFEGKVKVRNDS